MVTSIAPYGEWISPISAADVATGGVSLSYPQLVRSDGGDLEVWWSEGRPTEGGRLAIVRRTADGTADVLPAPWNARTRVHEYGGVSWLVIAAGLVFCEFIDQRLWLLPAAGGAPIPLTPEPDEPAALRYAELTLVGDEVWCIRERYRAGTANAVDRMFVAVATDGSLAVRDLIGGSDFLYGPRVSPDGRQLAWLAWNHPLMPWDGTELRIAAITGSGGARTVGESTTILGGPSEAVQQPEWDGDDHLYAITDRSGWWNLVRIAAAGGEPEPVHTAPEEFGAPQWGLGQRTYAVLADGRLAVTHGTGQRALGLLDPATGAVTDLELPYTNWAPSIRVEGTTLVAVAGSPKTSTGVVVVDLDTAAVEVVKTASALSLDSRYLPDPTIEGLPGPHGRTVHAVVYPPANPDYAAPAGDLPPYIVFVHGGPTSQAMAGRDVEKAFFTSRGLGVIDVNYGGSTGYGRAYRELLREQWGVVDVEDCVAAVQALADQGRADRQRLVIRGGSAGGWTVLAALTGTDAFAAGASYYGVAELLTFAEDTHDFESRYLDGLIGPLPETRDRYIDRAPLTHVDGLSCPVLLLQGDEDRVVPPAQSELFRDAMVRKAIPHAYLLFAGEQHGFRKAETIIAALSAELSFYGQVLGFEPPGVARLELTTES
jgi:dipeptidyl aminopeptidase/acylaminoacyl peptidase